MNHPPPESRLMRSGIAAEIASTPRHSTAQAPAQVFSVMQKGQGDATASMHAKY